MSDFRAILSSLEQEKAARQQDEPVAAVPASAAPPLAARAASPSLAERLAPSRPAPAAEAPSPRSFSDVRERLTALGDVSDMLTRRAPGTAPAGAPSASASKPEAAAAASPRRRGFGAAPRQTGEAEARRKRGAPKDVITWQRLGVLALFMAVVGGGAVALQSLAAREEAKVAPEVIGNAAVASVAPSAPAPAAPAPVAVAAVPAAPPVAAAEPAVPPVRASIVDSLPPVLRDTAPPFDVAATPPGVTAFAPPAAAAAPEVRPADVAAKSIDLPKAPPLPPRAPTRRAAAAADPTDAATEEVSDETDSQAGFGGDPVGSATIRRTVTMRAAPKKGATAIGNLSAGEKVQLVACRGWCEVIAEGKRGFVYKSFVDAGTSARADTAADSETTAQ